MSAFVQYASVFELWLFHVILLPHFMLLSYRSNSLAGVISHFKLDESNFFS